MERALRDAHHPIPTPDAWLDTLIQGAAPSVQGAAPNLADEAERHRDAMGRLGQDDRRAWALAHMDLGAVPARLRGALMSYQRELRRALTERLRNLDADKAPPGPSNPYACPLLRVSDEAARWFGVVGFDGWGAPKSLTLDPLDEPQRAYEAALVIMAERNRALPKPKKAEGDPAPRGATSRRR